MLRRETLSDPIEDDSSLYGMASLEKGHPISTRVFQSVGLKPPRRGGECVGGRVGGAVERAAAKRGLGRAEVHRKIRVVSISQGRFGTQATPTEDSVAGETRFWPDQC